MSETSDEQLLRDFLATGSRGAFGELYSRYRDKIYNTAFRIVGDSEGARDVAHDVFLKVYVEARSFAFRSSFSSWIYRITVNRSLDEARRSKRRRSQASMDALGEQVSSPSDSDNPKVVALEREMEAELLKALEMLSPKLKAVITLRYFESMSYEQVAEIIARPVGTVKSRLRRAHRRLGQLMADRGYGPSREDGDGLRKSE